MIDIKDPTACCGCSACQQICPKHCIHMQPDDEGFLYPHAEASLCVNCGRCDQVCPVINRYEPSAIPKSYACKVNDEGLRADSSSGGVFTILARKIISHRGVVFGACFKADWSVIHDYATTITELKRFRGSKYVQSDVGDSYQKVKAFLQEGRIVLFSGTPCQVAGLNHFLGKNYTNLYTIDIVCHSIPSPAVWQRYLGEIQSGKAITHITFRDKIAGWHNYGLAISSDETIIEQGSKEQNLYMRAFLSNLIVRPSCFACPARNYTSGSDIMLADCWGLEKYHPELDDDKGMSQALILTEKGSMLFEECRADLFTLGIPYHEVEAQALHLPITASTKPNPFRTYFFSHFKGTAVIPLITRCLRRFEKRQQLRAVLAQCASVFGIKQLYHICRKKQK